MFSPCPHGVYSLAGETMPVKYMWNYHCAEGQTEQVCDVYLLWSQQLSENYPETTCWPHPGTSSPKDNRKSGPELGVVGHLSQVLGS